MGVFKKKFAFLVHPRSSARMDMKKVFLPFSLVPEKILAGLIKKMPPLVRGKSFYETENGGKELIGWIIVVPLTGEHFFRLPRKFILEKIIAAVQKAKDLGADIVGLGELIAPFTHGGIDLVEKIPNIHITTGNSLTAAVVVEQVKKIAQIKGIQLQNSRVAIVGATGSVGSGVSYLMAELNIPILLVARGKVKLELLKKRLEKEIGDVNCKISTSILDIKEAEIVILTTSRVGRVLDKECLSPNTIIYDITQPRNVLEDIQKDRKDIIVIDGGIIDTPPIDYGLDIGLLPRQAYACLAETILLALTGEVENIVGAASPLKGKKLLQTMKKYPQIFRFAPFTSFGKPIRL